ncbi:LacI family DNA-binding transcriptional regulator [Isoptericola sp. BMS4]|uniref:LacI family DNA-binding transcriptional regulator n=1 Tax=Isoptericola sp. BMS4 TaxID=2527875 RepID=UPI00141EC4CC|nr:LacI family DNA-binding transcriptional regulator [Isoptericola sp. BMS4]
MATMQDVARLAGVSLSTVSYALSGHRTVSAATRERIVSAMEELGYQPNAMARGLASRRSRVLALVYPAAERGLGGTVAEFVSAAAEAAREKGHHLVLWPFRTDQADEVRDLVLQGMADGVLVMEVTLDDPRVTTLRDAGVPFTMIGRTRDVAGLPSVDVDFERTTREAVDHLVGLGHRHLAFVNHSEATAAEGYAPTFRAEEGFAAAVRAHGLEPVVRRVDESPQAGREAAAELLDRSPRPTAVVTMNEIATFGVVAELQQRGIGVPDEMSVLAIVTSPGVADMSNPPLTTMHSPGADLGRLAVATLLSQVAGDPPPAAATLIPCTLEPGRSVGPAPGAPPAPAGAEPHP